LEEKEMTFKTGYTCVCRWLVVGALALAMAGVAVGQAVNTEKNSSDQQVQGNDVVTVSLTEPAASAPNTMSAPPASSFSWTGFYVGGHVGFGGWGNSGTSFTPLPSAAQFFNLAPQTLKPRPSGPLVGGQGGFNWQASKHFVLGAEGDIAWSDIDGTVTISPITQNNGTPFPGTGFVRARRNITWLGTVRARLGFAPIPRLLIYGTGGLAYGHVIFLGDTNFRPVGTTDYLSFFDKNKAGSVAGAGVEFATSRRWSVKAEYLHVDLGSESTVVNAVPSLPPFQVAYGFETSTHILSAGVNFRF
jgi:outer membrane immunogenic protein